MILQDYIDQIDVAPMDQSLLGQAMGKAMRDKNVKPEQYEHLCLLAKSKGFKFVNIEAVPELSL